MEAGHQDSPDVALGKFAAMECHEAEAAQPHAEPDADDKDWGSRWRAPLFTRAP